MPKPNWPTPRQSWIPKSSPAGESAKAQTPTTFMKAAEEQTFGTNMAFFIGQGSLREKALGYSDAAPTKEQMDIMQKDLIEAMEAG